MVFGTDDVRMACYLFLVWKSPVLPHAIGREYPAKQAKNGETGKRCDDAN
jgi:hypothetical protein